MVILRCLASTSWMESNLWSFSADGPLTLVRYQQTNKSMEVWLKRLQCTVGGFLWPCVWWDRWLQALTQGQSGNLVCRNYKKNTVYLWVEAIISKHLMCCRRAMIYYMIQGKKQFFYLLEYPEDCHLWVSDVVEQWMALQNPEKQASDAADMFMNGYAVFGQLLQQSLVYLKVQWVRNVASCTALWGSLGWE